MTVKKRVEVADMISKLQQSGTKIKNQSMNENVIIAGIKKKKNVIVTVCIKVNFSPYFFKSL